MFLKSGKFNEVRKQFSRFRWDSGSLIKKLVTLYVLSTLGILFAVALFLYPTFNKLIHPPIPPITSAVGELVQIKQHTNEVTIECYKKSILALLLSAMAALGLGYIVARNGLRRLGEFESLMNTISASALNERVNLNDWPKELKNLGKTFNTMLDRLQTSFVQLTQFSSDLAHELRTPINNLRGTTEVALSKKTAVEYRAILESHLEEYQYLTRLIDNLLFIARSEHGQIELNWQAISVGDELHKVCDYYSALAEEQNIKLICDSTDLTLQADPILFRRAINNVISNALRYSAANSIINILTVEYNGYVAVEVIDQGIGIHENQIERVFDRFYRIDPSRSSLTGGLGLGLTLVKKIMELHQGQILLTSTLDVGTQLKLLFPAQMSLATN